MMRRNLLVPVIAGVLVLGILAQTWWANSKSPESAPAAPPRVAAATTVPRSGTIRVGIVVSEYTASGPHWTSKPYSYGHSATVLALRDEPGIEIHPIIEPGSESQGKIAEIIQRSFNGNKPINGGRKEELRTLDVIATSRAWNAPQETLDALEAAVKDGVGLLSCGGFGIVTPGHGPQVDRINGFAEGQYALGNKLVECEVIGEHPILGRLKKGAVVRLIPNGEYGVLSPGGVGLVRVKDSSDYSPVGDDLQSDRADFIFFPVYISSLGKGKIVGCSFPAWKPVPPDLDQAVGGKFYVRCVRWLAGKPLD